MPPTIAIVIPTYRHFDYAERAIRSAFVNTVASPQVLVLDDASPDWDPGWPGRLRAALVGARAGSQIVAHSFEYNGGLTRSWNCGLGLARGSGCDYACVANSDVVFAPGWDVGVRRALGGFHLVGPVTNAPGNRPEQNVKNFCPVSHPILNSLDDGPGSMEAVAAYLTERDEAPRPVPAINGFCMVARTETWWAHAFDTMNVFRPRNDFNSRGQRNPTPLMTLNDDELCGRWRGARLKIAVVPTSYVFHYRSVTRGDRYRCPGAYRPDPAKP